MDLDSLKKITAGIEGWQAEGEAELLYRTAKAARVDGVILEIGSYKGKSTVCLASGSFEGARKPVFAVDPHLTDYEQKNHNQGRSSFEDFKANIERAGVAHMITPIVKRSEEAVKEWDRPIAVLWIDGDHSYEAATRDFKDWSPFVTPGGTVLFHDSTYPAVDRVVRECLLASGRFRRTGITGTITFGTKLAEGEVLTAGERAWNAGVLLVHRSYGIARRIFPAGLKLALKKAVNRVFG
jgi:MMP 1-O-methyltransferase